MMFLPRLYARLCARQAGRTLLAKPDHAKLQPVYALPGG